MNSAVEIDARDLVQKVRRNRVGGCYWGAQPAIPNGSILVRSSAAIDAAEQFAAGRPIVLWLDHVEAPRGADVATVVPHECDPWYILSGAAAVVAEARDEIRIIASLMEVECHIHEPSSGLINIAEDDAAELLGRELAGMAFENPFTGEPMSAGEAIELCGFWRRLVDSNRGLDGGLGFAFWKQRHIAPLLWDGSRLPRFLRSSLDVEPGKAVAVWRAKASLQALLELESRETSLIEVEDGFLRSQGLGADCVPPLSITVDRLGPYFDPDCPSELECLLQAGDFDPHLITRARNLRRLIVEAGLGKYEKAVAVLERPAGARRHILVPGQVEDDRAVKLGGCGLVSNLDLLKRVREQAPEAYILYKPHPDVLAGHRRGAIADRSCLEYADQIVGTLPISSLIAMVDEVHVNTSLAGFEALLRDKAVTTYGVPFYAGWGLTRDLGPVPSRRTSRRTLDELVAATLLLYPRYLDPVTGLPCPAEIVVERLSGPARPNPNLIVGMRRLQGKFMRRLRSLVQ